MQEVEAAVEMNVLEGARRASYVAAISIFFFWSLRRRVFLISYILLILLYWNAGDEGQLRSKHS